MRPEYDLRGGVRGKYYERYRQGTNIVLLEPDVAKIFHDSETVSYPSTELRQNRQSVAPGDRAPYLTTAASSTITL